MTGMSYLSNMQGKGIFEGLFFPPGLKRDVSHGCGPYVCMYVCMYVVRMYFQFLLKIETQLIVGEERVTNPQESRRGRCIRMAMLNLTFPTLPVT